MTRGGHVALVVTASTSLMLAGCGPDGPWIRALPAAASRFSVAIQGRGYFCVRDANKAAWYTATGSLFIDHQGIVWHESGLVLDPWCDVPTGWQYWLKADGSGEVSGRAPEATQSQILCNLSLFDFPHPEKLRQVSEQLWAETRESGSPRQKFPGTEGAGLIFQR